MILDANKVKDMRPDEKYYQGYHNGDTSTPDAMRGHEARQRENQFYKDWERAENNAWSWVNDRSSSKKHNPGTGQTGNRGAAGKMLGAVVVGLLIVMIVNWAWQLKSDYSILGHTYRFVLNWYNVLLIDPAAYIFNLLESLYEYVVYGPYGFSTDTKSQWLRVGQLLIYCVLISFVVYNIAVRLTPPVAAKIPTIRKIVIALLAGIYIFPGAALILLWIGTMLYDLMMRLF